MAMAERRPRAVGSLTIRAAMALVAAVLAVIPLLLSRVDGDADLDPFFAILVVAALVIAFTVSRPPRNRVAWAAGRLLALAWLGAAAWAAFLLAMYQTACGCSMPEPSSLPPLPTYLGLPATAFHVLATYGGGLLVALAVFLPPTSTPRAGRA